MFDLYERNEAREAQKAFDKALAAFQGEAPQIRKSKKADRYYYAPLEEILKKIQPTLTKHGLSVRFDTKMAEGMITAYCTVAHEAGHKETSEFTCPIDKENKTKINVSQQAGSANSYAKRYALGNALNLSYCDEDDDGQAAGTEYITEEEQANIEALISETGADKKLFLKWASGASRIDQIPRSWYKACIRELERKREMTNAN
jgi:hypothetical protein